MTPALTLVWGIPNYAHVLSTHVVSICNQYVLQLSVLSKLISMAPCSVLKPDETPRLAPVFIHAAHVRWLSYASPAVGA